MDPIRWDESFSVGVDILNRQHLQIIKLINQLSLDVKGGPPGECLSEAICQLMVYSKEHFSTEEDLLERHAYPGLEAHRLKHRAFEERVLDFCENAMERKAELVEDMLLFLSNWWVWHIQCEDMEYRPLLEAKRA